MEFTTDGMRWEGLLRALQGDISIAVVAIIAGLVSLILGRRFIASAETGGTIGRNTGQLARSYANAAFRVLLLLTVVGLAIRFAQVAAVNRMPRADANKSGVYEQMKQNTEAGGSKPSAPR
jgi:hypothetical protein